MFRDFFFFRKSGRLCYDLQKYSRTGQPKGDIMENAHCMLDAYGYKLTPRICNSYCFLLQQWLHEPASMLRYTYVACLVINPVS